LKEATLRVETLDAMEIAFLGKALCNLRRMIVANDNLALYEEGLR